MNLENTPQNFNMVAHFINIDNAFETSNLSFKNEILESKNLISSVFSLEYNLIKIYNRESFIDIFYFNSLNYIFKLKTFTYDNNNVILINTSIITLVKFVNDMIDFDIYYINFKHVITICGFYYNSHTEYYELLMLKQEIPFVNQNPSFTKLISVKSSKEMLVTYVKSVGLWTFICYSNQTTNKLISFYNENNNELASTAKLISEYIELDNKTVFGLDLFVKENSNKGDVTIFFQYIIINTSAKYHKYNSHKLIELNVNASNNCFTFKNNYNDGGIIIPHCVLNCPLNKVHENSNTCIECESNLYVENNMCVSNCKNNNNNPHGYCNDESSTLNYKYGLLNSYKYLSNCNIDANCLENESLYGLSTNCMSCGENSILDINNRCIPKIISYFHPFTNIKTQCSYFESNVINYFSVYTLNCSGICPSNRIIDNICLCPLNEKVVLNFEKQNICMTKCPIDYKEFETNNSNIIICIRCPPDFDNSLIYYKDFQCVNQCGEGFTINNNNICVLATNMHCSNDHYYYNNQCLLNCPHDEDGNIVTGKNELTMTCEICNQFKLVSLDTCVFSCNNPGQYSFNKLCKYCYLEDNLKLDVNECIDTNAKCHISGSYSIRKTNNIGTYEYCTNNECLTNEVYEDFQCKTLCSTLGHYATSDNIICRYCDNNYYLQENKCVPFCNIDGLYEDNLNQVCISCPDNLYLASNKKECVIISNCGLSQFGKVYSSDYGDYYYCDTCPLNLPYVQHNICVEKCKDKFIFNENNFCIPCDLNINYLLDNNICINKCPINSIVNEVNKTCSTCKMYIYKNNCVNSCPYEYTVDENSNVCKPCSESSKKFIYNKECIEKCPEVSLSFEDILDANNVCKSTDAYINNKIYCSLEFCENKNCLINNNIDNYVLCICNNNNNINFQKCNIANNEDLDKLLYSIKNNIFNNEPNINNDFYNDIMLYKEFIISNSIKEIDLDISKNIFIKLNDTIELMNNNTITKQKYIYDLIDSSLIMLNNLNE